MMDDGGYKDEYGALLKMQNVDADDDDIEGRIVWLREQDRTNEYLAAGGGEAIPNRIILVGAEDSDDDQDVDMSNPSIIWYSIVQRLSGPIFPCLSVLFDRKNIYFF